MQELSQDFRALRHGTHAPHKEPSIKSSVVATVRAALIACGASPMTIVVYELIADCTDRLSWHEDGHPVCFREQLGMAAELGITDRQFRRVEVFLEQFGAIERATAENGYRGRRQSEDGTVVAAGLSLRPSILNIQAFESLGREAKARLKRIARLRIAIRITRRRIRTRIVSICPSQQQVWQRRLDEIDTRLDHGRCCRTSEEALLALSHALDALYSQTPEPSAAITGPVEKFGKTDECLTKMSGAPDIEVPLHIQPTTKPDVICSADATREMPAGKPAEDIHLERAANAARICLEYKHEGGDGAIKPEIARLLTPARLAAMASEDLTYYLEAYPHPHSAMKAYLAACGVNHSAWSDAVDVMGEHVAFIAALVLDRNREHPSRRIENLAGALRGITSAARAGKMDLTRSIIGLWKREEDGSQSRPRKTRMI
jgi:hypothetical protein